MSGGAFSTVLHRVGTSCGRHAQAGHMTSFDEVGQQGRLGTTMVYVRCRVLFCLTVWVSSLSHGSQRVALPIWGRVHRSSGIVRRWSLEKE